MTRLIYVKVQEALAQYPGFSKEKVLVVHTGPGNTRVLLFQKGRIVRYSCYRLGTHRTGRPSGKLSTETMWRSFPFCGSTCAGRWTRFAWITGA